MGPARRGFGRAQVEAGLPAGLHHPERLGEFARLFDPTAEVIAEFRGRRRPAEPQASAQAVLALLQRRPCTLLDVAQGLSLKPGEAVKLLEQLVAEGQVCGHRHGQSFFFQPVE